MSSGVSVRLAIMKMCSGSLTWNTHSQRALFIHLSINSYFILTALVLLISRFMICDYDHSQTSPVFLRRALTY